MFEQVYSHPFNGVIEMEQAGAVTDLTGAADYVSEVTKQQICGPLNPMKYYIPA